MGVLSALGLKSKQDPKRLAGQVDTTNDSGNESAVGYDPNYDPSKKTNAGVVTVDTLGTTGTVFDDLSASGRVPHKFEDEDVAEWYRQEYEKASYECRAYFDPKFYWEPKEEKKLLRKTEFLATGWVIMMFLALNIDRFNISNALAGSLLKDLKMTTNDYNLGSTLNLVGFLAAEIPSQLISKKVGPDVWIPTQICLWSLVAIFQCFITNKAGFLVTRVLIGVLEGGFIPDVILWLSYFYTGSELSVRIGYFYIANPLTSAVSSLIAYGIFHLDGVHGWSGWRYLFAIEGCSSLAIGVLAFFMMPASAVQTKTKLFPKGWYTAREEKIMVNRILRDDPAKGLMHNREALSVGLIWRSLKDYNLWPIVLTRLFADLAPNPLSHYNSLIIKGLGFSTLHTNLLLIPYNAGAIVTNVICCHISSHFKEHGFVLVFSTIWVFVGITAMKFWDGFLTQQWPSYALLVVTLSYPFAASLSVSWASTNSNSVATRTVSASVVNVSAQLAGIIGSNVFRKDDAPRYHRGLTVCFVFSIIAIFVTLGARYYYHFQNKYREAKWSQMSKEEQVEYIKTTTDVGSKRLDFRFAT